MRPRRILAGNVAGAVWGGGSAPTHSSAAGFVAGLCGSYAPQRKMLLSPQTRIRLGVFCSVLLFPLLSLHFLLFPFIFLSPPSPLLCSLFLSISFSFFPFPPPLFFLLFRSPSLVFFSLLPPSRLFSYPLFSFFPFCPFSSISFPLYFLFSSFFPMLPLPLSIFPVLSFKTFLSVFPYPSFFFVPSFSSFLLSSLFLLSFISSLSLFNYLFPHIFQLSPLLSFPLILFFHIFLCPSLPSFLT